MVDSVYHKLRKKSNVNEILHWSYSSVSKIIQCPRSWYVKYVLKMEQPTSGAANFGKQFDQEVSNRLGLGDPVEDKAEGIDEAVDSYLEQPWAWRDATQAQQEIRITPQEWEIYSEMYSCDYQIQRPFIGYIDLSRTDGVKRELVDLKTSKMRGFKSGWALQTLMYTLPTRAQRAEIHLYVRVKSPMWQRFIVRPTPANLRWALTTMGYYADLGEKLLKVKTSDIVPANPGYWCSWCPDSLECVGYGFSGLKEEF